MKRKAIALFFCVLSGVLIVQSCNTGNEARPLQNVSGEQLFTSLFFLQGNSAQSIQAIRGNLEKYQMATASNPEIKAFSEKFSAEIVKEIKALDPSYFEKFKEQMASKNYYAMELALTNGAKMVKAAGYRSSYGGIFRLVDDLNEKQVDFTADQLKGLDFSKKEDAEKLKNFLLEEYAINLDDDDYKVACIPVVGVCVVYVAGAVISIAAVGYTAAVVLNAAAWVTVYAWVELWGGNSMMQTVGKSDALIDELSRLM